MRMVFPKGEDGQRDVKIRLLDELSSAREDRPSSLSRAHALLERGRVVCLNEVKTTFHDPRHFVSIKKT